MQNKSHIFGVLLTLILAALACNSLLESTPSPSLPDTVATIVASTLEAIGKPEPTVATPSETEEPAHLLPHSLYYFGKDSAGLSQVFRMERDGRTTRQLTFEPVSVSTYDVSPVDGNVVYVADNKMILIQADGSGRRVLLDGGPVDENYLTRINSVVFSPDGRSIAYGKGGLNFYSLETGDSNLVIENPSEDVDGMPFPRALYWPEKYSPDGEKLLIAIGYFTEGGSYAIYYPASRALVHLSHTEDALICCETALWAADSTALYSALPYVGMFMPGLWRVDASTGNVTTLLRGEPGDGTYNLASNAYLAPDGQLYYFFVNFRSEQEFVKRAPLQLVRSAADGVSGRSVLRPDTFELLNEALWAPDASFVLVVLAPAPDVYEGGRVEIVYLDGRPNITLLPFAQRLKWGP